jgi:hypothetical protein
MAHSSMRVLERWAIRAGEFERIRRQIECGPVKARFAPSPEEFPWSSAAEKDADCGAANPGCRRLQAAQTSANPTSQIPVNPRFLWPRISHDVHGMPPASVPRDWITMFVTFRLHNSLPQPVVFARSSSPPTEPFAATDRLPRTQRILRAPRSPITGFPSAVPFQH